MKAELLISVRLMRSIPGNSAGQEVPMESHAFAFDRTRQFQTESSGKATLKVEISLRACFFNNPLSILFNGLFPIILASSLLEQPLIIY